jgi:hypothetical protein
MAKAMMVEITSHAIILDDMLLSSSMGSDIFLFAWEFDGAHDCTAENLPKICFSSKRCCVEPILPLRM